MDRIFPMKTNGDDKLSNRQVTAILESPRLRLKALDLATK